MTTVTDIKEVYLRQLYQVCLGGIKDWGMLYFWGTNLFRNAVEKCHSVGCSTEAIKAVVLKARRDYQARHAD